MSPIDRIMLSQNQHADTLTGVLNRCYALIKAKGKGGVAWCAADIEEPPKRVSEWVMQRSHPPRSEVAFKLQAWAAKLISGMGSRGEAAHKVYQWHYREAVKRWGNGQ